MNFWLGRFRFEDAGFRIIDSYYLHLFGGTGHVTISGGGIELRFWLDRSTRFLDLRACGPNEKWSSSGLIHQMLSGEPDETIINSEEVAFLQSHLTDIQIFFAGV